MSVRVRHSQSSQSESPRVLLSSIIISCVVDSSCQHSYRHQAGTVPQKLSLLLFMSYAQCPMKNNKKDKCEFTGSCVSDSIRTVAAEMGGGTFHESLD